MKTGHLEVRPIYLQKEEITRGHIFMKMLAYYLLRHFWLAVKDLPPPIERPVEEALQALAGIHTTRLMIKNTTFGNEPANFVPSLRSHAARRFGGTAAGHQYGIIVLECAILNVVAIDGLVRYASITTVSEHLYEVAWMSAFIIKQCHFDLCPLTVYGNIKEWK
jgi:hypothetical protein